MVLKNTRKRRFNAISPLFLEHKRPLRDFSDSLLEPQKLLATISYGWESADFYARWFGTDDPNIIREMQGPNLNPDSPVSPLSPILLALVTPRHLWPQESRD